MKDQFQLDSQALPAANANSNSDSVDLRTPLDGGYGAAGRIIIDVPATPNLANAATITFTVQDSADNASFATIPTIGNLVITGPASGGGLKKKFEIPMPQLVRRYLRVNAAISAAGGDSTATSYQFGVII